MNTRAYTLSRRQRGVTLVELLVALAISLAVTIAALYLYIASQRADRVLERGSESRETGVFVLQLLGREIMNAGFYPATEPSILVDVTQTGMYDTYYPLPGNPRRTTDWADPVTSWPPVAFQSPIFGCDSGSFDVATSTCSAGATGSADTIVLNSFTSDIPASQTGARKDCTGSDIANAIKSNGERRNNQGGPPPSTVVSNLKPQQPLFRSSRFTLKSVKLALDNSDINTSSLACSGNGKSPHGTADTTAYQPIVSGLIDLQFTYGVYDSASTLMPTRFYTATEVNALTSVAINGVSLTGWQRVTAVRVCVLTQTLGGSTRLGDKTGAASTYVDCGGTTQNQPSGSMMTRYTQEFGARSALKQTF